MCNVENIGIYQNTTAGRAESPAKEMYMRNNTHTPRPNIHSDHYRQVQLNDSQAIVNCQLKGPSKCCPEEVRASGCFTDGHPIGLIHIWQTATRTGGFFTDVHPNLIPAYLTQLSHSVRLPFTSIVQKERSIVPFRAPCLTPTASMGELAQWQSARGFWQGAR